MTIRVKEDEQEIVHDSRLIQNVLPQDLSPTAFKTLQVELEPHWSKMYHKGSPVPRLVCIQGSINEVGDEPLYRHPADQQPPLQHWTPTVQLLRDVVSKRVGQHFNHVLIQLYRNGDDFISEHSDKTLDIKHSTAIVNLSLGATRTMVLRPKKEDWPQGKPRPSTRVPMNHGSIFVLGWQTNKFMTHGISKDKREDRIKSEEELAYEGVRISLTFRQVATFMQKNGSLYGQGAPTSPGQPSQQEKHSLIEAFSVENRRSDYDWDEIYGKGFAVINFKESNAKSDSSSRSDDEKKSGSDTQVALGAYSSDLNELYIRQDSSKKSSSPVALLAIDLQNDFLGDDPSFFLARRGSPLSHQRQALLHRIDNLIQQVRKEKGHVIFIKAIYGEVSTETQES